MEKLYKVLTASLLAGAMFSSSLTAFAAEGEKKVLAPVQEDISVESIPVIENDLPFLDVKDGTEAFDAIQFFSQVGAVQGIRSDYFGVNEPIKRVDTAVVLNRINPLPNAEDVEKATFKDLPARAVDAVSFLRHYNVVNGKTGTYFGSDLKITRGEAAIMIYRAYRAKLAEESSPASFTDVTIGKNATWNDVPVEWEPTDKSDKFPDVTGRYTEAVDALVDAGVISGKSDGKFGTYQNITRSELVVILYRLHTSIYDIPVGDSTSRELPSSANGLTISLDKETYKPSEELKVTLTNTSDFTQVGIFNDFDLEVKRNGSWKTVPWNPGIDSNQEIIALNAKNGILHSTVPPYIYFESEKFPIGEYRLVQTFEKVNGSIPSPFAVAAKFKVTE